jgi:hypothetical protein
MSGLVEIILLSILPHEFNRNTFECVDKWEEEVMNEEIMVDR